MVESNTTTSKFKTAALLVVWAAGAVASYIYLKRNSKSEQNQKHANNSNPHDETQIPPEIKKLFDASTKELKESKIQLSTHLKLEFYGLYKQATLGNAPRDPPINKNPMTYLTEQAKYSAWYQNRGVTKTDAMMLYISAVQRIKKDSKAKNTKNVNNDEEEDERSDFDFLQGGFGNKPSMPVFEDDAGNSNLAISEDQLFDAASKNDTKKLIKLIDSGVSLDQADDNGQTALHMACDKGSLEAVQILLDNGANPCAADKDGISVLQASVIAGHVEVGKLLLSKGANPDQEDVDGDTPRTCAIDEGSEEMKQMFRDIPCGE